MEKRYQVFVSSTFADLKDERQAVTQALLSLDHFPAGMELFPASDDDSWTLIQGVIDDSDYYLLVIAGRYGSVDEAGVSYTEKEFEYALSVGKPVLAFLHEDPGAIAVAKTDQSDAAAKNLKEFCDRVKKRCHVKLWKNADDLKAKVIQSIAAETKRNPQEGWVRAGLAGDPRRLNELLEEVEQLKTELATMSTTAPQGSSQYSQGNDSVEVLVKYEKTYVSKSESKSISITWNQIVYELGPLMLEESSEGFLRDRLNDELRYYDKQLREGPFFRLEISNDSFETIKVQLMALGIMQKSNKKHAVTDHATYWSLTPYGEQYLVGLRAIKRPGVKSNSDEKGQSASEHE
ncbi:DUF4062 domain-containing protein [Methyloceanibacter sp.]|uniref:DUF4062 domain-containing protein n=1 Tax=Methyloceanibacter sp. TaxID=1965321 RepID=UPI003D6D6CDE